MSNVIQLKTKPWCQVCGDGFGSEEYMFGRCCGMEMIEIPYTKEDYENERKTKEAMQRILAKANKINWD